MAAHNGRSIFIKCTNQLCIAAACVLPEWPHWPAMIIAEWATQGARQRCIANKLVVQFKVAPSVGHLVRRVALIFTPNSAIGRVAWALSVVLGAAHFKLLKCAFVCDSDKTQNSLIRPLCIIMNAILMT